MGNNARRTARLYFVPSGYVDLNVGRLGIAGNYGLYWSGRAYSSSGAYSFYFRSSGVNPSNSHSCYAGFSVRCVAGWE